MTDKEEEEASSSPSYPLKCSESKPKGSSSKWSCASSKGNNALTTPHTSSVWLYYCPSRNVQTCSHYLHRGSYGYLVDWLPPNPLHYLHQPNISASIEILHKIIVRVLKKPTKKSLQSTVWSARCISYAEIHCNWHLLNDSWLFYCEEPGLVWWEWPVDWRVN